MNTAYGMTGAERPRKTMCIIVFATFVFPIVTVDTHPDHVCPEGQVQKCFTCSKGSCELNGTPTFCRTDEICQRRTVTDERGNARLVAGGCVKQSACTEAMYSSAGACEANKGRRECTRCVDHQATCQTIGSDSVESPSTMSTLRVTSSTLTAIWRTSTSAATAATSGTLLFIILVSVVGGTPLVIAAVAGILIIKSRRRRKHIGDKEKPEKIDEKHEGVPVSTITSAALTNNQQESVSHTYDVIESTTSGSLSLPRPASVGYADIYSEGNYTLPHPSISPAVGSESSSNYESVSYRTGSRRSSALLFNPLYEGHRRLGSGNNTPPFSSAHRFYSSYADSRRPSALLPNPLYQRYTCSAQGNDTVSSSSVGSFGTEESRQNSEGYQQTGQINTVNNSPSIAKYQPLIPPFYENQFIYA